MKIKRVFLIVIAGVLACMMSVYILGLIHYIKTSPMKDYWTEPYYVSVMSYVSNITFNLRAICLLAVADFLFCVGQKRYNKSMLGISVASLALALVIFLMSFWGTSFFFNVVRFDDYTVMGYFFLWTTLSTLPFVGLMVAYIVVKVKYLKSQSKNNEMIVENN